MPPDASGRETGRIVAVSILAFATVLSPVAGSVSFAGAVGAAPGDVLYRANAGGEVSATDGGPDWVSDGQYVVGGDSDTASNPTPDGFDGSVPSYVPSGVWTDERYDPPSDGELGYEFPVQSGQRVEVRLYFYDGYGQTSDPGDRVFDVAVEDRTVTDFDPIAEYGDQTAGMETVTVVSDGTIDVDFAHDTENPQINAIEIVSAEPRPDTLGGPGQVDFGTVVTGDSGTEQVTLTNLGGSGDPSIDVSNVSVTGTDADAFSVGTVSRTTLAPGESATVPVTVAPSDAQPNAATLSVDHSGSDAPLTVALSAEGASDVPVGFGVSGLDVDLGNPTSLEFGPDGRLYVAQQSGAIKAFEIARNGPNDYEATATEVITAVRDVPNHDDDGSYNSEVTDRQVTGLTVAGTPSTPVLYVSSSDPRIGAGGSGTDVGLDTNSGVVSRLTRQSDGTWDHDMLVRGLPRSEENHATNGLQYDAEANVLYVAQGGHTNKGAPSNNFAYTPEYALSAAILSIDLDRIEGMSEKEAANTDATYRYDLPTLDPSSTPTDGPFGGRDGDNMAKWVSDSPVDVYSPGWRNPYDIALNSEGQLYTTDNGANPGWGGVVVNEGTEGVCTNAENERNEFSPPGVYRVDGEDFYGGHPNPTRGNPDSEFGTAVESGLHDPVNCDYRDPAGDTPSAALETYGPTPQGVDVYEASNFGGAMEGDLLLAMWNSGDVKRVELNADGTEATDSEDVFENIGNNPLDVHAQGDEGPFPGTVWAATYGSNDVTVFEPNDYGGTTEPACTADDPESPDYDPDGDADGDGYTNADENAVGTNPCSQASQPADYDGDGEPDPLDPDDDDDGIPDTEDPFAVDPQNGLDETVPVDRQFTAGQYPRSLFGLGFTGLMTNGTDYADLYDESAVRAGGATETFSVDSVPFGDAYTDTDTQGYAFQYGVDAPDEPFVVRTTVEAPFPDDVTPENYQSAGLQVGAGDQDDYVKLVAGAQDADGDPDGGVQFLLEEGGTVDSGGSIVLSEPGVVGSGRTVDLFLTVDPTTDPTPNDGSADVAVTAAYSIDGGERVAFDETLAAPESWFTNNSVTDGEGDRVEVGTAVGLISTANQADGTFSASWDRLTVAQAGTNTPPTADAGSDRTVEAGRTVTLDASGSSDPDAGDTLGYSWTQTGGPDVSPSVQDGPQPTFTAPDVASNATLTFAVAVSDGSGATDTDTVTITVTDTDDGPAGEVVFAANAGGPEYTAADGTTYAADTDFDGGDTTGAGDAGIPSDLQIDGTDDDPLYATERFGENFGYDVPVPENGTYEVTLAFAEIYQGVSASDDDGDQTGDRVFDVSVEGEQVLTGYDIYAEVGTLTADDRTYTAEVTDGTLNVEFNASADTAKLSAIEVRKVDSGGGQTGGEATLTVDGGEGVSATTYDDGSYVIENTGDEEIETVSLDLSTAVLPDVVSDPDGTAGDQGAKGFTPGSGADAVGLVEGSVSVPHNGVNGSDGYDVLTVTFDDFQPGESFAFAIDNDPTSIKGGSSVQSGEAGPISGLELAGSTMTTTFADGATVETNLFGDGSAGGSQAVANADVESAPTVGVRNVSLDASVLDDRHSAATVSSPNQTITVTGDPGRTVTLLRIEGELNLVGVPDYDGTPGYRIEAFEANDAVQVEEYAATVGSDGTATVPVTLTDSTENGGLNYFVAAVTDDEGEPGRTSNTVVLELDPDAANDPPTIDAITDRGVTEGESVTVDVPASDPDGDDLTYTLSGSGAGFVTGDGDGTLTVAPGADAVGTYTVTVTADDGAATASETFAVYVDEPDRNGTVVLAANAGGPAVTATDGTVYQAGSAAGVFAGGTASGPSNVGSLTDATDIAGTDDDALYRTELYGGDSQNAAPNVTAPVENGTYEVTLRFAEIYQGVAESDEPDSSGPTDGTDENDRLFDVSVEGRQVLTEYDVYSEVGPLAATDKTYTAEVTDGTLNVDFAAVNDNAKLSAVTVESLDPATAAPTADAGADRTVEAGDVVTLDASGSTDPDDGDGLTYDWTQTGGPTATLADDATATATFTAPDVDGETTLTFEVAVADGDAADTDVVNVTVEPAAPGPVGDFESPPTDPDGDGVYEDVNGDGAVDVGDTQAIFANAQDPVVRNDLAAFDFNGDGSVNVGDAQALFANGVNAGDA